MRIDTVDDLEKAALTLFRATRFMSIPNSDAIICPFCGRDVTGGHAASCPYPALQDALIKRKAQREGRDWRLTGL